jgi:GntR family transcriptional regulator
MFFRVDPQNGLAIYEQVVRQVKFAVASGMLKAGQLIPSVRELAHELAINPNTIARAYRQLQEDRVIEPVRGTGLEVAEGALDRCRSERRKLIAARVRQVLVEARQSRLDAREVRELVERELTAVEREGK